MWRTPGKIETFSLRVPKDSVEQIINIISKDDSIYFLPNDALGYHDIFKMATTSMFLLITFMVTPQPI